MKQPPHKMAAITTTHASKELHIYICLIFDLFQFIWLMYSKGSSKQGTFTLCDVSTRDRIIRPIRHELGCTGRCITGL